MDTDDFEGAVWLRREALADGYTDRQIAVLVRTGAWHRIRRGAYCSGELWRSLSHTDRHRLVCRAVLKTAHPSTVLSHVSAAVEHGAPVWLADLSVVHTTRRDGKSGRKEYGVVHHRGDLPPEQVVVVNGVPVTSPARTVIETCTMLDVEAALVTANGMLHAGKTSLDELVVLARDTRFWPSSIATRMVLDLAHPQIESALETRIWHLLWREHLSCPEPQVEVRDERGVVVARVDFAWRAAGVYLEADGRAKYEQHRLPGETLERFLMREKRREELICLLTGWTCIRVGWSDLDRPRQLAARIRRILRSRQQPA